MKALVTVAGKRLGREMALHLGKMGFDVAVHFNGSQDAAQEVVSRLCDMGRTAHALQADLLIEAEVENLIPRACAALNGPLTLLVNNASIFEEDRLETATRTSWDRHMESNLHAPFVLSQCFSAQASDPLIEHDGRPKSQALVINMIDQRVRKLTPQFMSYTLAKSALWTFTQTAAQALAPKVRVNAIGPGPTLQGARQTPENFRAQQEATLLHRGSAPSDVCDALEYLVNAPSLTGQILCVDGGQHLAWETPDVAVPE